MHKDGNEGQRIIAMTCGSFSVANPCTALSSCLWVTFFKKIMLRLSCSGAYFPLYLRKGMKPSCCGADMEISHGYHFDGNVPAASKALTPSWMICSRGSVRRYGNTSYGNFLK
jgi:hypothetical protein